MDISGPFWMLIRVHTLKGKTAWKVGSKFIYPKEDVVWLFVPPFHWTSEFDEAGTLTEIEGLFSDSTPKIHWPKVPCLIYSDDKIPRTLAEVSKFFKYNQPSEDVALESKPSGTALKVKNLLDRNYASDISMSSISGQLKTSNAVISRQFKCSFGFTPMVYKRGLRVTVAMFHLLSGKAATEAASLAGYNDLGRFYKQFKEYIRLTPESHRVQKGQKTPIHIRKIRLKASKL